jgi:nitroimidazol reductase NimA-like FMN-containing flavoprotein (pyridoxamine 5'-phosphate oxidase superfamily)
MEMDGPEIQTLSRAECLHQLEVGGVGRIALRAEGAPILRPVNFALHEGHVLIRTGEGTILAAADRGDPASFEIDDIDFVEHTGWSVVLDGKLHVYLEERDGPAPPLRAWASGVKDRFVVLRIDGLSGLRIPAGRGNR